MIKALFEVPVNWSWTTMGEIADVIGGGTPKTKIPANYQDGTIPWLTPADLSGYTGTFIGRGSRFITEVGLSSSSARMMPAGTVLFTSRAPIGYVAIASNEICTNQGFKSFVLKSKEILPEYVYWWLKGNKELAESYASGTTFLELSGSKAKLLPIPIAPPEQQKRIVAEIEKQFSRLDEAVANLKRVKANLKRYKAAVLKAAVEGKLTEEWRKQHPDVEPADKLLERILEERRANWEEAEMVKMEAKGKVPKDDKWKGKYKPIPVPDLADLPEVPDSWCWLTIEQFSFVTKLAGFEYTKFVKYDPAGDLAVIKAENAGKDGFKKTDFSKVKSETVAHLTRSMVKAGDLLMVFVGAGTGQVARVPDDQPYFLGPNIGMIRIESERVLPAYLELYLRSPVGNQLALGFAKAVAQPSLSMGSIRKIPVPIPPLNEQVLIVDKLEEIISKIAALDVSEDNNSKRSERLRQSILKKAFSGELVPQGPDDEPASVLLKKTNWQKIEWPVLPRPEKAER